MYIDAETVANYYGCLHYRDKQRITGLSDAE